MTDFSLSLSQEGSFQILYSIDEIFRFHTMMWKKCSNFFFSKSTLASSEAYVSADGSIKQSQHFKTNTTTLESTQISSFFSGLR